MAFISRSRVCSVQAWLCDRNVCCALSSLSIPFFSPQTGVRKAQLQLCRLFHCMSALSISKCLIHWTIAEVLYGILMSGVSSDCFKFWPVYLSGLSSDCFKFCPVHFPPATLYSQLVINIKHFKTYEQTTLEEYSEHPCVCPHSVSNNIGCQLMYVLSLYYFPLTHTHLGLRLSLLVWL